MRDRREAHVLRMMDRDTTAVLVHDVTNDFIRPDGPYFDSGLKPMLANIKMLLTAAREAAIPIIFAVPRQGDAVISAAEPGARHTGTPGGEVPSEMGLLPGEKIVRKPRWGAFHGSELAEHLTATGRDTLVICGVSLAGGVETTVRDGFNHGIHLVVVADACLARAIPDQGWGKISAEAVRKVTLSVLAQRFADVVTTGEICEAFRQ